MRIRLGFFALGLIMLAGLGAYATRPSIAPAVDFLDALRGPAAPNLSIPFEAYALTPEGLLRTASSSTPDRLTDRPMVRTRSAAYLSRDFVFEVDVTIPAGIQDVAFVGFGQGEANPGLDNEPGAAILLRLHNVRDNRVVHAAVSRPPGELSGTALTPTDVLLHIETIGKYVPGTTITCRIERAGNIVTLSLPQISGAQAAFDLSLYPSLFDERSSFLFFGNSAEGTVFSNVRVRPRG